MKNISKDHVIYLLSGVIVALGVVIVALLVFLKPQFAFSNTSSSEKSSILEKKNSTVKNPVSSDTPVEETQEVHSNSILNSNSNDQTNSNFNSSSDVSSNSNVEMPSVSSNSNSTTENVTESTNHSSSVDQSNITEANSEEELVLYLTNEANLIEAYSDQNDVSFREKVKNSFVTIVDFIFYDKPIKGYTFDELTTKAKLKVIQIALSIDKKIDQYFPNYRETIKDKYNDIKGQLAVKYLDLTSALCEKVGDQTCNQAREDFKNMKESFGFTWELIKSIAGSGKDIIKEWYESIR